MRLADANNPCFGGRITVIGAAMRPPRSVRQRSIAGQRAAQPLVTNIRTDPETPAQLPPIDALTHRQPDKLTTLIHYRHLSPWHGRLPNRSLPAIVMCQPCLRTPVSGLCGPNIQPGDPVAPVTMGPTAAAGYWMPAFAGMTAVGLTTTKEVARP